MMTKRSERRAAERALRQLVRDREKLAGLVAGGSADHPIEVASASVIEGRATATPCVQCEGEYRVIEHRSVAAGLRAVDVRCRTCQVGRTLWFRIAPDDPN